MNSTYKDRIEEISKGMSKKIGFQHTSIEKIGNRDHSNFTIDFKTVKYILFLNNILMDDGNFNKWLKENKLDM